MNFDKQWTSEAHMDPDIATELEQNADRIIERLRRGEDVGLDEIIGFGSDYVIRRITRELPDAQIKTTSPRETLYRVTSSPHRGDRHTLPWEYLEDNFINWVGEVFCEAYKAKVNAIDTVEEALSIIRDQGYTVEVVE